MSVDERELHDLHNGLEEVLGSNRAATLMSRLSPVPWPDVATNASVKADIKSECEKVLLTLRADMANLRTDLTNQMAAQTRTLVVAFVMALLAVAGLVIGVR